MRKASSDRDPSLGHGVESVRVPSESRVIGPVAETLEHDLEDHIYTLRDLDEQRRISAKLRGYGIKVLEQWIKSEREKRQVCPNVTYALPKADPSLYARIIEVLYHRSEKPLEDLKEVCDQLIKDIEGSEPQTEDSPLLKQIKNHDFSVLFAAELMGALVTAPDRAYSKPALLCYYWVIREIYTADAPAWSIGGARRPCAVWNPHM
jgi:hypothetical protein